MNAPSLSCGVRFRRDADGAGLLLIPEGVVNLNGSAAAILELVDGQRSVDDIARELALRFHVDVAEMTSDVRDLLERLCERSWIVLGAGSRS